MFTRCFLTCLLCCLPISGGSVQTNRLNLQFYGIADQRGQLVAALWDSADRWLSKADSPRLSFAGPIVDGRASWQIDDLPFGRYAVSAYHDANGNGELDSGLFGIPREDYGFSNNAGSAFGPPGFEAASFVFERSGQTLEIRID